MKIMQKDRLNERVGSGLMMQMNKFIDLMKEADGKANENYLYLRELRPDFQASQKVLRVLMLDWTERVQLVEENDAIYKYIASAENIMQYQRLNYSVPSFKTFGKPQSCYNESLHFITSNYESGFIREFRKDLEAKSAIYQELLGATFRNVYVQFAIWLGVCLASLVMVIPISVSVFRFSSRVFSAYALISPDEINDFIKSAADFNDCFLQEFKRSSPKVEDPDEYDMQSDESFDYRQNKSVIASIQRMRRGSQNYESHIRTLIVKSTDQQKEKAGQAVSSRLNSKTPKPGLKQILTSHPDTAPTPRWSNEPEMAIQVKPPYRQEAVTPPTDNSIPPDSSQDRPSELSQHQKDSQTQILQALAPAIHSLVEINELDKLIHPTALQSRDNPETRADNILDTEHLFLNTSFGRKAKQAGVETSESEATREEILNGYRDSIGKGIVYKTIIGSLIFFPWCIMNLCFDFVTYNRIKSLLVHHSLLNELNWMIPHLNTLMSEIVLTGLPPKIYQDDSGGYSLFDNYTDIIERKIAEVNQLPNSLPEAFLDYAEDFELIMNNDLCTSIFGDLLPVKFGAEGLGSRPSNLVEMMDSTGFIVNEVRQPNCVGESFFRNGFQTTLFLFLQGAKNLTFEVLTLKNETLGKQKGMTFALNGKYRQNCKLQVT